MKSLLIAFIVVMTFAGCDKKIDCPYDPCANKVTASEIQSVKDYLTANSITATEHCSGLFYKIDNPGTGDYPDGCSVVSVNYIGKLTNGYVFDQIPSSSNPGPISFGLQNVIRGWTNAVPMIREGGKITLYIPPTLAYGSREIKDNSGNVIIPANSILVFEISLISVQ